MASIATWRKCCDLSLPPIISEVVRKFCTTRTETGLNDCTSPPTLRAQTHASLGKR